MHLRVCDPKIRVLAALMSALLICALAPVSAGASDKYVVPLGNTVGIRLDTNGIIVSGLGQVETPCGVKTPARDAGIKPGDVIIQIDRNKILSAEDLRNVMREHNGEAMAVRVSRGGGEYQFSLYPEKNTDGNYELGLWLRDGISGIGTMTYYDPESGCYGALGHAITDVDTGVLMPVRSGAISRSEVTGIVKGAVGAPGELVGSFNFDKTIGSIDSNSYQGIFGTLYDTNGLKTDSALEVAGHDEIQTGKAAILSNICGDTVNEYEVEILKIYGGDGNSARGLLLQITDGALLEQTGGIVQGMSGSPIIQNGRMVGAVTHVLVNDPAKGYGILIENMLDAEAA